MKFSQGDPNAFEREFRRVISGESYSVEDAGSAFAVRLLKSIRTDWNPGEPASWRPEDLRRQLGDVANGNLTLLPSEAEVSSELKPAFDELSEFVRGHSFFPQELKDRVLVEEEARIRTIASSAAMNRQEKDGFDRDAAAYLLSALEF